MFRSATELASEPSQNLRNEPFVLAGLSIEWHAGRQRALQMCLLMHDALPQNPIEVSVEPDAVQRLVVARLREVKP